MFIYQRVYQFPMAPMRAIETVNIDNVAHMEPEKNHPRTLHVWATTKTWIQFQQRNMTWCKLTGAKNVGNGWEWDEYQ